MRHKATLKDLAIGLGVSVSTVSKALSNSEEISESTKIKVKEFAALYNYQPNAMAKNLKNQRTNTIGVIIPNILNPFFAKVFSGIENFANKKGYNVITYISNESFEKEKQALELLSNGTVDGFIISIAKETQILKNYNHYNSIIKHGMPIVMFDRVAEQVDCDKVIVDDYESSVNAVNHLIKLNCQKIALLSCIDDLSIGKLRANGYEKALLDNNIEINPDFIIKTDNLEEFDLALTNLILQKQIDGVFALDEHSSTMAMKLALLNNIRIPEDLCIIGFADGIWSRRLTPSLSTVSQHGPEIGKKATELLIKRIENKQEDYNYKTTVINTELRKRDSTRR